MNDEHNGLDNVFDTERTHGLRPLTDPLPTLPSLPQVKVINAAQFAAMHTAHMVAHPPDGVLFPFLHGLEGENHAQNTFFAATAPRHPPRFRGLVWVVADDDLSGAPAAADPALCSNDDYDDDEYSDEDDDDEDEDELPLMDVDRDAAVHIVRGGAEELPSIATLDENPDDAKHMHPVHNRGPIHLQTVGLPLGTPSSGLSSTDGSYFATPGTDVQMEIVLPPPSSLPPPPTYSPTSPLSPSSNSTSSDDEARTEPCSKPDTATPEVEDWDPAHPPLLTCTFRPRELLRRVERPPATDGPPISGPDAMADGQDDGTQSAEENDDDQWEFRPGRVPDGISLRNFGIQVSIYATLSDIVVYSPKGVASPALASLASRFVSAVDRKRAERCQKLGIDPAAPDAPLEYNVFVLDSDARGLQAAVPELMMRVFEGSERRGKGAMHLDEGPSAPADAPVAVPIKPDLDADVAPNTVDFGQRERDEMRELTRASEIVSLRAGSADEEEDLSTTTTASHWRPLVGQIFLGNSGDVPLGASEGGEDPFNFVTTNSPMDGMGYDVCVECHEMAPFPSLAHLRAAEDHITMLDGMWDDRVRAEGWEGRVRPPPNANAVIHLPFPSAPSNTPQTMNALLPVIAFLDRCIRPLPSSTSTTSNSTSPNGAPSGSSARRWSTFPAAMSPSAFFPSPPPPPGASPRTRSFTSPAPSPAPAPPPRTRPLKVLIYSSDGYTESSPLALSLLMAVRRLSLPEAYLELQVAKRRSFFVYPGELGVLRRVEGRIAGGEVFGPAGRLGRRVGNAAMASTGSLGSAGGMHVLGPGVGEGDGMPAEPAPPTPYAGGARPSAKSVSFAKPPDGVMSPMVVPSQGGATTRLGRPRARTSPWLPSFGDHQSWFNDTRFDGSFPSRVLPFLYLGNLNHASNAYMLHALGITHVVSVGECALVPPPGHCTSPGDSCTNGACRANHNSNAHFIQGKGPGNQGSLWFEEREGRIKVLDIKGVCDDGIDTLEPQLEPICDWIEKARQEGGHVLVHCRVGVSRSATVTIAYVMKHLSLPLVDAYLIVRSRRLSVLIQPNMRLLYNLCGWEIKLAKERAGGDERRLRKELARTLTWPFLSKEVHALNEKYLH
ncbi:hypothetical protein GGX14DRAFT_474604 [Mycena pura]|uniref:Protein-tyrosine-phosphatase n=1 Tax=Mycena pura TaxID=153505 RepID=A0AAD6UZ37_9AGAR|nr:hypothetical protein GGX14DRAFT_474604 [Mycena pura]